MVYAFISSIAKGYRTSEIATLRKFTLLGREHPYPLWGGSPMLPGKSTMTV